MSFAPVPPVNSKRSTSVAYLSALLAGFVGVVRSEKQNGALSILVSWMRRLSGAAAALIWVASTCSDT